jgi:hypothetical protein
MKRVDQTILHVEGVSLGNCQQAVVASVLGLPIEDVPNFNECRGFWNGYHAFLKSRGFIDVELPNNRCPDCFYLAYGKSPRGVLHAVVYHGGNLAHDPHPSRAGIIAVDEVHLIVPIEIGAGS